MKKHIALYLCALLVLSLVVTGIVYASNTHVASDESEGAECSVEANASFEANAATENAGDTAGITVATEPQSPEAYDPPFIKTYTPKPTTEERLRQLKERLQKGAEDAAAREAEKAALTAEREALLSGRSENELTAEESKRLAEIDARLEELFLESPRPLLIIR